MNNTNPIGGEQLPSDENAEKAFLCSMILDPALIDRAGERVTKDSFHLPAHQSIWECLRNMRYDGSPIDLITVTSQIEKQGAISSVGGEIYITDLCMTVSSSVNWEIYLESMLDCSTRRRIILAACELYRDCFDRTQDPVELQERASKSIISFSSTKAKSYEIKDVLNECINNWEAASRDAGKPMGVMSGFDRWDMQTRGMQPGTMHVIAGAAKAGKTTLALQMVAHAAIMQQIPAGIISLEMSRHEIVNKISSGQSAVALNDLLDGRLTKSDYIAIQKTVSKLGKAPIFIVDEASMTVLQFRARARRLAAENKVKIIILDYAQLVEPSNLKESRERQVAEVSRMAKIVAKELDICVLLLCQLNEDGNVRESRTFYMDCDSTTKITPREGEHADEVNLNVTHNRHGFVGPIPFRFNRHQARFVQKEEA